jgi:hypothetical protein
MERKPDTPRHRTPFLSRRRDVGSALLLVLAAFALAVSSSSCSDDGNEGVEGVVDALTQAKYEVSLLTLNIQGINENWNGTLVPWRDRYGRIVQWGDDTGTRLDLIVLEEVWLRLRYFAGGLSPYEYETLFELVTRLNERTGLHYRVAYASSARTSLGLHTLFAGQAVIYNADRLRNTTSQTLGASETLIPWSDEAVVGVHMRESYACAEPRPEQLQLCSLIDPDGYLTSPFTNSSGRWDLVATASAFSLRDDPQSRIVVHNVHLNFGDFAGSFASLRDLLTESKVRSESRQLTYSPLIVGDFNIGLSDMQNETGPGGRLEDFEIAGYVGSDVIGALIGKPASYSPRFSAVTSSRALPKEEKTGSLCAPPDVLWSDHCALYLSLLPPT